MPTTKPIFPKGDYTYGPIQTHSVRICGSSQSWDVVARPQDESVLDRAAATGKSRRDPLGTVAVIMAQDKIPV